jgi:hypothetical protein
LPFGCSGKPFIPVALEAKNSSQNDSQGNAHAADKDRAALPGESQLTVGRWGERIFVVHFVLREGAAGEYELTRQSGALPSSPRPRVAGWPRKMTLAVGQKETGCRNKKGGRLPFPTCRAG